MQIMLLITFEYSLKSIDRRKAENKDLNKFIAYIDSKLFEYDAVPRLGEYVDIEDILFDWCEDNYPENNEEVYNKLYSILETDQKVMEVKHNRSFVQLYCSDMYCQE